MYYRLSANSCTQNVLDMALNGVRLYKCVCVCFVYTVETLKGKRHINLVVMHALVVLVIVPTVSTTSVLVRKINPII